MHFIEGWIKKYSSKTGRFYMRKKGNILDLKGFDRNATLRKEHLKENSINCSPQPLVSKFFLNNITN